MCEPPVAATTDGANAEQAGKPKVAEDVAAQALPSKATPTQGPAGSMLPPQAPGSPVGSILKQAPPAAPRAPVPKAAQGGGRTLPQVLQVQLRRAYALLPKEGRNYWRGEGTQAKSLQGMSRQKRPSVQSVQTTSTCMGHARGAGI